MKREFYNNSKVGKRLEIKSIRKTLPFFLNIFIYIKVLKYQTDFLASSLHNLIAKNFFPFSFCLSVVLPKLFVYLFVTEIESYRLQIQD